MHTCKPLPYGQLTTALVPTVPSPCFLRQSATVTKVRDVSFYLIRFVIGELLSEVGGRVSHGLVMAWFESYVLRLVFLQPPLLSRERETFWYLFCQCTPYGSRISLTGEEEERRRRKKN